MNDETYFAIKAYLFIEMKIIIAHSRARKLKSGWNAIYWKNAFMSKITFVDDEGRSKKIPIKMKEKMFLNINLDLMLENFSSFGKQANGKVYKS